MPELLDGTARGGDPTCCNGLTGLTIISDAITALAGVAGGKIWPRSGWELGDTSSDWEGLANSSASWAGALDG